MSTQTIQINGHDLKLSKVEKELFPEDHVSKGDMVGHYRAVAAAMLPHLASRPLTLRRFPDGIGGSGFFQKHAADYFPDWLRTETMDAEEGTVDYVVCEDEASLVYLANQAAVEFHVWLSTVDKPDHPDRLVIDLDPPDGTPVAALRETARRARDLYAEVGLTPFVQATGGRGFHVAAPLDRSTDFDTVREFATELADRLAAADPDRLTTAQRKAQRGDRIFLDCNRNAYGQTFVCPYSLRARPGAPVATPLDWNELGRATPNGQDPASMRRRLARKADPWADMDAHAASAAEARKRLLALGG
ncbi:non-homologous end-joining DNA ligase [Glycomyces algeriensis]|uniref:ATP-dependent DNA ligase n=1 Tax=Glycomyces algeriensis TaxID=256037 RepID=A0A9W6LJ73_9ACTN|nr:non-homologous end-joining DNA ligase [Glycomyces algeriensis]MDA1367835.1 non-homologous end-joining DNA ligase [Glycomyces algeriensis]MDR7351981.1 bifunctional non-homologous end joining protein LigD [Glycomyces algeriensis]GLI44714.1 ATP-dependent DNA ligase [Glycomyces algeriensis]